MRSTVVLPQPDGPRNETNSPCSISRLKSLHARRWPEGLVQIVDLEKCHGVAASIRLRRRWLASARAEPNSWIRPMQRPGDREGDDRQRRRLVGAVGADQLQVGAEGRAVRAGSPW